MSKNIKNIEFVQGVDFELLKNLPNNGTKYLIIFDESCEEISSSKEFEKRNWLLLYINIAHQQQSNLLKDLKNAKFYHPTCVRMWKILMILVVRRLPNY